MTVSSTTIIAQYTGNGATTAFAFSYPFFDPSDLVVSLYDTSAVAAVAGVTLNGGGTYGYTVTGTKDADTGEYISGATITFNNAPLGNHRVTIQRDIPATQNASLNNNAPFLAKSVEAALDRMMLVAQQLDYADGRALHLPATDDIATVMELPAAANRANLGLGFDSAGNLQLFTIPTSGSTTAAAPVLGNVTNVGTTYTFQNSDLQKVVTFNNASAIAAILPQAGSGGSFIANWCVWVINLGAGLLTITPTTSTINGLSSIALARGQSAFITSNGTNYFSDLGSPLSIVAGGAITAQTPTGGTVGGNTRGAGSVDFQTQRAAATQVASGSSAFIGGGNNNTASGAQAVVAGGSTNIASGNNAVVAGGTLHTASGNGSGVGGGTNNSSGGVNTWTAGENNVVTGQAATALGSGLNTNGGAYSFLAGYNHIGGGSYTILLGQGCDGRSINGIYAQSGSNIGGSTSKRGRSQFERHVLVASTSGSAAVRLTVDGAAAAAGTVPTLLPSSLYQFEVELTMVDTTTGRYCTYTLAASATITQGANAAATAMGTSNPSFVAGSTSAVALVAGAAPTVTADTSIGALNLSMTPPAANTNLIYITAVVKGLMTRWN